MNLIMNLIMKSVAYALTEKFGVVIENQFVIDNLQVICGPVGQVFRGIITGFLGIHYGTFIITWYVAGYYGLSVKDVLLKII